MSVVQQIGGSGGTALGEHIIAKNVAHRRRATDRRKLLQDLGVAGGIVGIDQIIPGAASRHRSDSNPLIIVEVARRERAVDRRSGKPVLEIVSEPIRRGRAGLVRERAVGVIKVGGGGIVQVGDFLEKLIVVIVGIINGFGVRTLLLNLLQSVPDCAEPSNYQMPSLSC